MYDVQALNASNVVGNFNKETSIFYVNYCDTLDADTTHMAYQWLVTETVALGGVEQVYAFVFDFTAVKRFQRNNTLESRKQSQSVNENFDLQAVPAALIVENEYQEQKVLLSIMINGVQERSKICKSHAEAMTFIERFHARIKS